MNNAKWIVFGCCFLAMVGVAAVWYVERKIAQVTEVVDGAVDSVQETVNAPFKAADTFLQDAREWNAEANDSINRKLAEQGLDKFVNPVFEGLGDAVAAPFYFLDSLLK